MFKVWRNWWSGWRFTMVHASRPQPGCPLLVLLPLTATAGWVNAGNCMVRHGMPTPPAVPPSAVATVRMPLSGFHVNVRHAASSRLGLVAVSHAALRFNGCMGDTSSRHTLFTVQRSGWPSWARLGVMAGDGLASGLLRYCRPAGCRPPLCWRPIRSLKPALFSWHPIVYNTRAWLWSSVAGVGLSNWRHARHVCWRHRFG